MIFDNHHFRIAKSLSVIISPISKGERRGCWKENPNPNIIFNELKYKFLILLTKRTVKKEKKIKKKKGTEEKRGNNK